MFINMGNRSLRASHKQLVPKLLNMTTTHDSKLAYEARKQGFSSIQIRSGSANAGGSDRRFHVVTSPTAEIIVTSGACTQIEDRGGGSSPQDHNHHVPPRRKVSGACIPSPARTGWGASRSCKCSNEYSPILNCAGSHVLKKGRFGLRWFPRT